MQVRAEVATKAFTKETEALKALLDYEWTKIKTQLQRDFVLMHIGTNG